MCAFGEGIHIGRKGCKMFPLMIDLFAFRNMAGVKTEFILKTHENCMLFSRQLFHVCVRDGVQQFAGLCGSGIGIAGDECVLDTIVCVENGGEI